ncbi:MAG: zf-HC2 domain-containing protein [Chloroflexales bacterium]|nr:zf-HC2 domain-containing protein [Chloroflexales bacterium]
MPSFESTTIHLGQQTQDACPLVQDLLPLFVEDEVSPSSREVIAAHLSNCEYCRGYLAGARSVRTQLRNETSQRANVMAASQPEQRVVHNGQTLAAGIIVLILYSCVVFSGMFALEFYSVGVFTWSLVVNLAVVGLFITLARKLGPLSLLRMVALITGCLLGSIGLYIQSRWPYEAALLGLLAVIAGLVQVWVAVVPRGSTAALPFLPQAKGRQQLKTPVLFAGIAILLLSFVAFFGIGALMYGLESYNLMLFNAGLVIAVGVVMLFVGLARQFGPLTPTRTLLLLIGSALGVFGVNLITSPWSQIEGLLIGLIGFASILVAVVHRPQVAAEGSHSTDK